MSNTNNKYIAEEIKEGFVAHFELESIKYSGKSEFQSIEVCQLTTWGKSLFLDGKIQSCEKDEFIYHEGLVHPALLSHPNPKRVFIGGGGEGGTAREVLRNKSVEKVTMVDIDPIVCETSKEYFPSYHKNCWENERFELIIDDAKKYLMETEEKFDVIIFDLADPVEEGPCYLLYTKEFYTMVKTKLNEGGILVTQSGPAGKWTSDEVCYPVHNTLNEMFDIVSIGRVHVPSFLDMYSYCFASDSINVKEQFSNIDTVENLINERLDGRHEVGSTEDSVGGTILNFLDGESGVSMFLYPKWFKDDLKKNNVVITDDNPAFMY